MLIQQNVNAKTIQAHVGHESIEETMDTYGHLFPTTLKDLASNLDDFAKAFELEDGDEAQTA